LLQLPDHSMKSIASWSIPGNVLSLAIGHHDDTRDVLKCAKNLLPVLGPEPSELYGRGSVDSQVKYVSKSQLTLNMTASPPCKTHRLFGIATNPGVMIASIVPSARHALRWKFFPHLSLSEAAACALSSSWRTSCHVHFSRSKSKSAWSGACLWYRFRASSRSLDAVSSYHRSFEKSFVRTYEISFD
jgi:hypothetical protein